MKLDICVYPSNKGEIMISEKDIYDRYIDPSSDIMTKGKFKIRDTVSLDLFVHHTEDPTKAKVVGPVITDRSTASPQVTVPLPKDGWYTITRFVLPSKKWVEDELKKRVSIIKLYPEVYFLDKGEIWMYGYGKYAKATLANLKSTAGPLAPVAMAELEYVYIGNLESYAKDLYMDIFKKRMHNGECEVDACEANRLNAMIALIKHYVKNGQLAEASRVIEKVRQSLPGMKEMKTVKPSPCGCS